MTIVLGIESSCDDTCAAVLVDGELKSSIVISQQKEHELYKGVVPEIASRAHMVNLEKAISKALVDAGITISQIDAVAATSGPGLIGGVIAGCMYAKAIAFRNNKPFVAVNHLEGHILSVMLDCTISYPYLVLLASGGHTQFVEVLSLGKYKILGQTLDDAVGESFDKVAKMLNLGFPGGPEVETRALLGEKRQFNFPKPLWEEKGCNFSFSGLKTAVRIVVEKQLEISDDFKNDVCASFQYVVGEVMAKKCSEAVKIFAKTNMSKNFVLVGGVASNEYLVDRLNKEVQQHGFSLLSPSKRYCTDNAAMIALAGYERLKLGLVDDLDFAPRARWKLDEV